MLSLSWWVRLILFASPLELLMHAGMQFCRQHACALINASLIMQVLMQEFTNYHFDVKPNALHGALDRFAQFFIDPLCKADALEREVMAVDNEFSGMCYMLLGINTFTLILYFYISINGCRSAVFPCNVFFLFSTVLMPVDACLPLLSCSLPFV